jgi:hypothetical protein
VSCTSVSFLFCSILLLKFHFSHSKQGFFKCFANQSNLVPGSSLEVSPDTTSFTAVLHTYHLSQLEIFSTIYLLCLKCINTGASWIKTEFTVQLNPTTISNPSVINGTPVAHLIEGYI